MTNLWQRAHELPVNKTRPPRAPSCCAGHRGPASMGQPGRVGTLVVTAAPRADSWTFQWGTEMLILSHAQLGAVPPRCLQLPPPLAQQPGLAWAEVRCDQCAPQSILNDPE